MWALPKECRGDHNVQVSICTLCGLPHLLRMCRPLNIAVVYGAFKDQTISEVITMHTMDLACILIVYGTLGLKHHLTLQEPPLTVRALGLNTLYYPFMW